VAERHWLGLDVGTSSVKALLVSSDGVVRARADAAYDSTFGPNGEAEQDSRDYLAATRDAIAGCGVAEVELGGIGLVGQTPTLVLVDGEGEPVRPALTWQDARAVVEARELAAEYGPSDRLFGIELPWTPAYPPAKLFWLARHERQSVKRTRWVLQPKDFVGLRLTGSPLSDPWSTKGLCNVLELRPATEILERTGWSAAVVPPLASAWQARGGVTARAASTFGLPEGAPVTVGWSDALAGMLAVGAFDAPTGFVLTGTSSIVGISTDDPAPHTGPLFTIPDTCAPLSVVYGPTQSGGASVEWLARLLRCEISEVLALAAAAPAGGDEPPLFVPYLAGERAPIWSTEVRGAFLGLSARDGAAELARAVVTGVCLSERHVLAAAERQLGAEVRTVHVAGRGASRPPWRDVRLAVVELSLSVLDEPDASALGAAMLGAAAANGGDLLEAPQFRGLLERVEPEPGQPVDPRHLFQRYLEASGICVAWVREA
jgi:xylulokinase